MSLTNHGERLFRWAVENKKELRESDEAETFWKKREGGESGLWQYQFETLKEMQDFFENEEVDKTASLILCAEAIKNKSFIYEEKEEAPQPEHSDYANGNDIPDFVYIF